MNANASTLAKDSQTAATWRLIVGYVLMLLAAVAIFFAIRHFGERLAVPSPLRRQRQLSALNMPTCSTMSCWP